MEKQLIVAALYKAIVRPRGEFIMQTGRPYDRNRDIAKLYIIQRRATKMIPELRNVRFESRLNTV